MQDEEAMKEINRSSQKTKRRVKEIKRAVRSGTPAKVPPWSLRTKATWSEENRALYESLNVLLVEVVTIVVKIVQLFLEAGMEVCDLANVSSFDSFGDYKISKVTSSGWLCLETLAGNGKLAPRIGESAISIELTDSNPLYHDFFVVLQLDKVQYHFDIATACANYILCRICVYKIYKETRRSAESTRLVYANLDYQALVLWTMIVKSWSNIIWIFFMYIKLKTPAGTRERRQGCHE